MLYTHDYSIKYEGLTRPDIQVIQTGFVCENPGNPQSSSPPPAVGSPQSAVFPLRRSNGYLYQCFN